MAGISNKTRRESRTSSDKSGVRSHPAALSQWIARISQIPLLTHEQEIELGGLAREGDQEAFTRLVQSNLRLVVRIATRYAHPNVPLIDLVQEGNIGLIQAVERFDPDKGYRFSTYAVWWIRRAILRSLSYDSRLICLPEHIVARTSKMERQQTQLRQKFGREPDSVELADELETTPEQVEFLSSVSYDYVSIDMELPMPGHMTYCDVLEDDGQRPERWWEKFLRKEEVSRLLDVLPPREQAILRARFGIDDGRPLTLKETGRQFNLTRERIRQIEKQALGQLRDTWVPNGEASDMDFAPANG
ncbi:MAG: sigma-70 family RNA polymerase sigma factor [Candidatus Poribacteria bacterium]|nr:sigma-70 family RNA polymerase sigma factor [Candidatus Poribacteria bacterium]